GHQRSRTGQGAFGRLPRVDSGEFLQREAAPVFHVDGGGIPDQQFGPGGVHVRTAEPIGGSALFKIGPDQLPQRTGPPGPGAEAENSSAVSWLAQTRWSAVVERLGNPRSFCKPVWPCGQTRPDLCKETLTDPTRGFFWFAGYDRGSEEERRAAP